jgi:hypothetical protein
MANATSNLIRRPYGLGGRDIHLPVDGGSNIWDGVLVSQLTATGMAVHGTTAGAGPAVGVATHQADNLAGADGAKRIVVETERVFEFNNAGGADACSEATLLFSLVYMQDDNTIANNAATGTLKAAGRFMGMSEDGKVRVFVGITGSVA